MIPIKFIDQNIGALEFIGSQLNKGHDFIVESNSADREIDYLFFFDSRGISRQYNDSLANKLVSLIAKKGQKYLLVCRPFELTTWATFVNFIIMNKLKPSKIITNMGFVDFTPKKLDLAKNAVQQVEYIMGSGIGRVEFVEQYLPSSGNLVDLYAIKYLEEYKCFIENVIRKFPTVIINTPPVERSINIERKRPAIFYDGLAQSIKFNQSIAGARVIDLPLFDERYTYDAVHYTDSGNQLILDFMKEYL